MVVWQRFLSPGVGIVLYNVEQSMQSRYFFKGGERQEEDIFTNLTTCCSSAASYVIIINGLAHENNMFYYYYHIPGGWQFSNIIIIRVSVTSHRLQWSGVVKSVQLAVQVGYVMRPRRTPVVQSGMKGESVSEAVSNGKPARTLQLSQYDYHLSGNKREE